MKKLNFLLLILLPLFASNALFGGNKDGRILMYARLSAAQEVPAISSKAKGLVAFTLEEDYKTMTIYGVFDSLSGPATNCHLHLGVSGSTGNIVLDLSSLIKGNVISGKVTVTKAILEAISNFSVYINVHTAANSNGEIRGQVELETDYHFNALLNGPSEVPAVNTSVGLGVGSFVLSYNYTKLEYKVLVTGLSGAITAAHLHYGGLTTSGGAVYPLTVSGTTLTGTLNISADFVDSLFLGSVYINVHTAANLNGEIRGQLSFGGLVAFDVDAQGANIVPTPIASAGKALGVGWMDDGLDTLNYMVVYDNIVPTAAHFHIGSATTTGGNVAIAFTPIAGIKGYQGRVAIKPDTLAKILRGEIYMNLHTAANTNGEIRGQTFTSVREGLVADLCGGQEVPALPSVKGVGVGLITIDRNKTLGHLELVTSGLTANATLGHIHGGVKGVNGNALLSLPISGVSGNAVGGLFTIPRTTFSDSLANGLMYLNVHTTANANGEIRGQIAKTLQSECLNVGTFELNGESLPVKIYPNPMTDAINITFDSNEGMNAQIVVLDLVGRTIISKDMEILRGPNQQNLHVANLTNGIYFIQLHSQNRVLFTEKMVKE